MRIAILGCSGGLGSELTRKFKDSDFIESCIPLTRNKLDITSKILIQEYFRENKFDYVFNCTAYSNVNLAEENDSEFEKACVVNGLGVSHLSNYLPEETTLVHFSTDYVFDGENDSMYKETDLINPVNNYGQSKALGEKFLKSNSNNYVIFRLQWLYGLTKNNFFQKILEVSKKNDSVKIISDEYGSPCSYNFVSNVMLDYLKSQNKDLFRNQTFHLTHDNHCSRYECGSYFLKKMTNKRSEELSDIVSSVRRPKNTCLDNTKLRDALGKSLGTWEQDLDDYISLFTEVPCLGR